MQNNKGRHLGWKTSKENARLLLEALHSLVDGDLDKFRECDCLKKNVDTHWEGTNLWVKKTRLRDLVELTQKCGKKVDKEQIRNAIHCLKDLGILEDKRGASNSKTITGSDKWSFVLNLRYLEKQENVEWLFGKENQQGEWERRRLEKQNIAAVSPVKTTDISEANSTINLQDFSSFTASKGAIAANNRGSKLKREGELIEARKQFELAIKINPDNAASYYNLAKMYEEAGKLDKAIELYSDAAFLGFAAAYCNLARLYIVEYKDCSKAVENIWRGWKLVEIEKVEDDKIVKAALLTYLAWAWKEQERWQEALSKLQEAVKLQSDRGLTYGIMAEVLENLGQKAEATEAWKNCLRYAKSEQRDEDIWIGKARQRLE